MSNCTSFNGTILLHFNSSQSNSFSDIKWLYIMRFSNSQPFVSVIIPAYNAHNILPACLRKLKEQSYLSSRYEVIVVDNGSSLSLAPIVEAFEGVIYLVETKTGSYAARNLGIQHARGEILAFTDSDCLPSPNWIENGVAQLLNEPDAGLIGGHIQLSFKNPDAPTVMELCDYLSFGGFPQRNYVERCRFGATANVFTTREVIAKVGDFNVSQLSGGDLQWGNRVAEAGYKLIYGADASVTHPARNRFSELVKKARRLQGGAHDVRH
ncbi:MAG: glycosyltransferase family 2 protein, partial [Proteobacteria bacterium]